MNNLDRHLQDYLNLRRALGFKLAFPGHVLPQFVTYLEAAGADTVTVELAIAWAGLPSGVQPISLAHRLGAVRGFARYLATIVPTTEIPPCGIWPAHAPRPTPYLWADAEVSSLLEATHRLRPPLRAATYETLFGLLAASGLRVSEAIRLTRDDVELDRGVVTIQDGKFARSRLVPLHPSTTSALCSYARLRDQLCPTPKSTTYFTSSVGTALSYSGVHTTFVQLADAAGLRTPTVRPRIHDLRHSFAVRTLIDWHRSGINIQGRMAVLSNYLGHVSPEGTYWYYSDSRVIPMPAPSCA
jgi:integrase/recombinase XerD